ncbi:Protein ALP1-like [Holothuria leucospilota]|uniref:Protein ALP1-like n=1 Tax=Holothuria leucospilota TaxID=206669 RepID=A0A9Q1HGL5_HOLLE|nr:Protein ALP1-like [Holothuria leucospilota]
MRKRMKYVRYMLQRRRRLGEFHLMVPEQRVFDNQSHMDSFRMNPTRFQNLLEKIGARLHHKKTHRDPIGPAERLAVTLKFLATGIEQKHLANYVRMGRSTLCYIVRETCQAIWDVLQPEVLKVPGHEDWLNIADCFDKRWDFPHCIGAIDGKHVVIQAPALSVSTYFNYKHQHSIVLMAVCDGRYRFTLVDIGAAGRNSDGGIFAHSPMGMAMENGSLDIPKPCPLTESESQPFPYVFVGDEAFPLKNFLMRPFPGRDVGPMTGEKYEKNIYNYRLSRARRIIVNTFGIWSARWRIFKRPIIAATESVELYIKATICLHNWLRVSDCSESPDNDQYCPSVYTDTENEDGSPANDGQWRTDAAYALRNLTQTGSNMYTRDACDIRNNFKQYFVSEAGSVPWQEQYIRRGSIPDH